MAARAANKAGKIKHNVAAGEENVSELIKCAGDSNCNPEDGDWYMRHQTDVQII